MTFGAGVISILELALLIIATKASMASCLRGLALGGWLFSGERGG